MAKTFTFFRIFLFRGISLFLGGCFTTSRSSSFCSGVFLSLRIRILIRTAVFGTLFGLDFASSWTFASRLLIVFAVNEKVSIIHVILREMTFTSFNFTENLSGGNLSEFPTCGNFTICRNIFLANLNNFEGLFSKKWQFLPLKMVKVQILK